VRHTVWYAMDAARVDNWTADHHRPTPEVRPTKIKVALALQGKRLSLGRPTTANPMEDQVQAKALGLQHFKTKRRRSNEIRRDVGKEEVEELNIVNALTVHRDTGGAHIKHISVGALGFVRYDSVEERLLAQRGGAAMHDNRWSCHR